MVLLERLGFPTHATKVTDVSLSLLLDVCIKNELEEEIKRLFYVGERKKKKAKERLKTLALLKEEEKKGLSPIKRLALFLFKRKMKNELLSLYSTLNEVRRNERKKEINLMKGDLGSFE